MADNNSNWTAKLVNAIANKSPKDWTREEAAYMEQIAERPSSDGYETPPLACPFPSGPFHLEVLSKAVSATVPLNEPLLAKLWTGSTSKRGQWWVDVWFLDENEKGWTARLLLDPAADGTLYRVPDTLPALESRTDDLYRAINTLAAKQGQPSEHINIYGDLREIRQQLCVVSDSMWRYLGEDDYDFHWHVNATMLQAALDKLDELLLKE